VPAHSGSKHDRELHDIVYDELAASNLDDTSFEIYNTLLSFPDMQKPNFVRVFQSSNSSQNIASEGLDGHSKHSRSLGFVGYSPSANITVKLCFIISFHCILFRRPCNCNLAGIKSYNYAVCLCIMLANYSHIIKF